MEFAVFAHFQPVATLQSGQRGLSFKESRRKRSRRAKNESNNNNPIVMSLVTAAAAAAAAGDNIDFVNNRNSLVFMAYRASMDNPTDMITKNDILRHYSDDEEVDPLLSYSPVYPSTHHQP